MRKRSTLFFVLLSVLASATLALAQPRPALETLINSLAATQTYSQVAISPDGTRVAWSQWEHDACGRPTWNSAIYVAQLANPSPRQRVTAGSQNSSYSEREIAWSPDGTQLAFLSNASGQTQLFVADVSDKNRAKPPTQLTNLTGYLASPSWSPDGKTIAFLFTENAPRAAGPLMPMTPETGVVDSKIYEQRLTTVDLESHQVRQLSPADMYVYEYDWAPDGRSFAVTAAHGEGDNNWYIARLYTLALDGQMHEVYRPPEQMAQPHYSPDGKFIAFIAGIMSDEGATGGDIYTVPATGGQARDLTPGIKASPNWLVWSSTQDILFTENLDGRLGVANINLVTGNVETRWTGSETIGSGAWGDFALSLSKDQKQAAVIRQSFSQPPEIWAGLIGSWKQITNANQNLHASWGAVKDIHWSNGGQHVQGWLMFPADYNPGRRYGLVVDVHGGPAWAHVPTWPETFFNTSLLSSMGYFVLYPNPRGSYGQGEAFTRGNIKDFGYGDFHDILAGVDQVVKDFPVDNNRVGITGWSYGGYMTMWAVTQTNRFHAAVSGAGLSDWLSYYGENDIVRWMTAYFGASVYDNPQVYARSAPMTFIKNVKTPTLVLVGERDGECPAPQSREFWHALRTFGVPTQFVVYPGEGHFIGSPEHQLDILRRTVQWFDKYLGEK
ncbi:MAG TPA: S9 family peptidase [Terriglobales bacterium]|nr:S9 family peptidase [Terriglobales bacterium]